MNCSLVQHLYFFSFHNFKGPFQVAPCLIKIHKESVGARRPLEEDVLWADVIAARHEALHHQGHAQSIKYTVVLRNSKLVIIKIVKFSNCFKKLSLLHIDKADEEDPIANVPNVAEDIVEGSQLAIRLETQEVVIAKILITFGSIGSFRDDQL